MKQLLLIGGGHAHAEVLRQWAQAPLAGVALTLVTPEPLAPYSGMVPGWLAGTYRHEEIGIDMAGLCRAAGARLVIGEVAALDATARRLRLQDGQELGYDRLSLNIGSTLHPPQLPGVRVLALRPLGALRAAWVDTLAALQAWPIDRPLRVTAVGGGAAGAEALLAVCARLRHEQPAVRLQPRLVSRGAQLLPGLAPGAARALAAALHAAGVAVQTGTAWAAAAEPADADTDLLLWATGAQPHAWPGADGANRGLALDAAGFIRISATLQSVSHPEVYAVGDCSGWPEGLPKAGVFAVRMGPVLAANLRADLQAALTGSSDGPMLQTFQPQRRHLVLLATGDGRAIAARGAWSAHGPLTGRLLWRWKDRIDRRFLARYAVTSAAATT